MDGYKIVRWLFVCRPFPKWWATPHGDVDGQCITTIMSVATAHGDVDGLLHACAPSFRWSTHRRDVDGLCHAVSISMGYTSPGCRRVMPRPTITWPKVATHRGSNDNAPALWCAGRRWPHRVQMRSPVVFDVGTEGGHIGSKSYQPCSLGWGPKVATLDPNHIYPALWGGGQTPSKVRLFFNELAIYIP